jgi:hypothetical protein
MNTEVVTNQCSQTKKSSNHPSRKQASPDCGRMSIGSRTSKPRGGREADLEETNTSITWTTWRRQIR